MAIRKVGLSCHFLTFKNVRRALTRQSCHMRFGEIYLRELLREVVREVRGIGKVEACMENSVEKVQCMCHFICDFSVCIF